EALRPPARRRRVVRRATHGADERTGADQRSDQPLSPQPEVGQPRRPRGQAGRGRTHSDRLTARAASWLVSDRIAPLPDPELRAVRSKVCAPGGIASDRPQRLLRGNPSRPQGRSAGRAVPIARDRRRRARARASGWNARARHPAPRRLACAAQWEHAYLRQADRRRRCRVCSRRGGARRGRRRSPSAASGFTRAAAGRARATPTRPHRSEAPPLGAATPPPRLVARMKLVLTVLARDEADVIDAQVAFHLNAGVDYVVATDNNSRDGTTEILEAYA